MVSHDIFGFATDPLKNFFADNITGEKNDKKKPIAYGLALSSTSLTGGALITGVVVGGLFLASSPVTTPVAIALATTALGVSLVAGVSGYLIKKNENSEQNYELSSSKNDLLAKNRAEFQSPESMIKEVTLYTRSRSRIIGEDGLYVKNNSYFISDLLTHPSDKDEERAIELESRFMKPSLQPNEQHLLKRSESISSKSSSVDTSESSSVDTSESGSVDTSESGSVDPSQLSFTEKIQIFNSSSKETQNTTQKRSRGRG